MLLLIEECQNMLSHVINMIKRHELLFLVEVEKNLLTTLKDWMLNPVLRLPLYCSPFQ